MSSIYSPTVRGLNTHVSHPLHQTNEHQPDHVIWGEIANSILKKPASVQNTHVSHPPHQTNEHRQDHVIWGEIDNYILKKTDASMRSYMSGITYLESETSEVDTSPDEGVPRGRRKKVRPCKGQRIRLRQQFARLCVKMLQTPLGDLPRPVVEEKDDIGFHVTKKDDIIHVTITVGTSSDAPMASDDDSHFLCGTCNSLKVLFNCGHFACQNAKCLPSCYAFLKNNSWFLDKRLPTLLNERLWDLHEKCPLCRPEALCEVGPCPGFCSTMNRRGYCGGGATCNFCHMHGKGYVKKKRRGQD